MGSAEEEEKEMEEGEDMRNSRDITVRQGLKITKNKLEFNDTGSCWEENDPKHPRRKT